MNKIILIISLFLVSCGEGRISISEMTYYPKIVINGFITPGRTIDDVRIQRNFPVGVDIDRNEQFLTDASVILTKVQTGDVLTLVNNLSLPDNRFYDTSGYLIEYGTEYRLDVRAVIDGDTLSASSTTITPNPGLAIVDEMSQLGSMHYLERNSANELKYFRVVFQRSSGTQFYAVSMTPLQAEESSFIYPPDNPFVSNDVDSADVVENLGDLRHAALWIQDTPDSAGISGTDLYWFFLNFYGPYHLTLYAGDRNFRDFIQTYDQVQDIDGNFFEPVFHIEGDGIGVFASYVADTSGFTILRPEE